MPSPDTAAHLDPVRVIVGASVSTAWTPQRRGGDGEADGQERERPGIVRAVAGDDETGAPQHHEHERRRAARPSGAAREGRAAGAARPS